MNLELELNNIITLAKIARKKCDYSVMTSQWANLKILELKAIDILESIKPQKKGKNMLPTEKDVRLKMEYEEEDDIDPIEVFIYEHEPVTDNLRMLNKWRSDFHRLLSYLKADLNYDYQKYYDIEERKALR